MKSFDEPRLQYLKDHPFPSELHDVLVSDRIPKAEVLRRLEKAGAKIPERTLAFYANQGLIEKPLIASRKTGQGRESYFTVNVIERIKTIKKYQSEGHSLEEIRDRILSPDKIRRLCDKAQKAMTAKRMIFIRPTLSDWRMC